MMSEIIKTACYRTGSDYASQSSESLATAISTPIALKQMTKAHFFTQILRAGGLQAELAQTYQFSEFQRDLARQLEAGSLANVKLLASVATALVSMSKGTVHAINTVIVANQLSLVDVVAAEFGESAPETITVADVDAALAR